MKWTNLGRNAPLTVLARQALQRMIIGKTIEFYHIQTHGLT